MNPSLVLTLAAGLLLLLSGINSGRPGTTDETSATDHAEGAPPADG